MQSRRVVSWKPFRLWVLGFYDCSDSRREGAMRWLHSCFREKFWMELVVPIALVFFRILGLLKTLILSLSSTHCGLCNLNDEMNLRWFFKNDIRRNMHFILSEWRTTIIEQILVDLWVVNIFWLFESFIFRMLLSDARMSLVLWLDISNEWIT